MRWQTTEKSTLAQASLCSLRQSMSWPRLASCASNLCLGTAALQYLMATLSSLCLKANVKNISEYAGRLLRVAVAVIVKGMKRGEVMVAYVMAAAAFLAWAFNIIAMSTWYNMKKSIKWIRIGWACAFLAPFLISTYPMKSFIDLHEANGVVLAFRDTLNQHFLEESIRGSEYADARANASHAYINNKLEQAQIDLEHQQIATQRDFDRFGAEMEGYSEESHRAIMDSMTPRKLLSQHKC